MTNERITENIIREHFLKSNDIIIEEQQSNNEKIKRLLKNASKNGISDGRPDFIIQYKDNANIIIVIECKADTNKHESKEQNNYKDYAVDGVRLYTSFLAKEFDVIAIAVSGMDAEKLKISHFLQLKGTNKFEPLFATEKNKLLSIDDYLEHYYNDNRKWNQDLFSLLSYAKTLNDTLHKNDILESNRSLLIAGTLIVLQNRAFKNAYKEKDDIDSLIADYLSTIRAELKKVNNKHIEEVMTTFAFLKGQTTLSSNLKLFKDIITQIEDNIDNFMKTYQYRDVLGQFYIEFLRYAMNNKKSGIVLTPPHIADLFVELAGVNENSIIFDNCAGTGGFLIAAMQKMIKDCNSDIAKMKEIRTKQIIGIEKQNEMFSLLCCNMSVHGDGRSNLFRGSCFDDSIKKEIKRFHPDVGFLNPPYNTSNDELHFIYNNLSLLRKGSYCIAIVPMSSALTQSGTKLSWKQKLLQEHTLDAVLSMPNELFENSKTSASTCIMIFKAHEPHPKGFKTWFGYCKDDGFSKRKTQGRADYNNQWKDIKIKWATTFRNRDEITGFSVKKEVNADDEWCVEAYMETDYKILNIGLFNDTIMKYLAFNLYNKNKINIKEHSFTNNKITLSTDNWKKFNYNDVFKIDRGKSNIEDDTQKETPLIGASQNENGSNGEYINAEPYYTKPLITVGNGGNTGCGQCFFQSIPFNAKSTVNILDINEKWNYKLNEFVGMFLVTVIKLEKYRFNFGRGWSKERMQNDIIKLPVTPDGKPDFCFMENYIKSMPYSKNLE